MDLISFLLIAGLLLLIKYLATLELTSEQRFKLEQVEKWEAKHQPLLKQISRLKRA